MSGEREIYGGSSGSHDHGSEDTPEGANIERLQGFRDQSSAFDAAADRAFAFAEGRASSPKEILNSIRNTGGQ